MIYFVANEVYIRRKKLLEKVFSKLPKITEVKLVNSPEDVKYPAIVFVGSGGTASEFLCPIAKKGKPVLFIAYGENNSLPAALDGAFRYKSKAKVVYTENISKLPKEVEIWERIISEMKKEKRIGCIGKWKTEVEKDILKSLNTKAIEIPMKEFLKEYNKAQGDVKEKSFIALTKIKERYNLDGLSIKCFDLLPYGFVPCYGIAKLGNRIPCACEGDFQSLITLMILRMITKYPCFMANLARIDKKKNSVIFAHCTIPTNLIKNVEYVPHMESGLNVSLRGNFVYSKVTIVKYSRGKLFFTLGKIIRNNMKIRNLCRMQLEIKVEIPVNKWIQNALGNHHIIAPGDLTKELEEVAFISGLKIHTI